MIARSLLVLVTVSLLVGCSAFQSPNAGLGDAGANSVTTGDWRVAARGEFTGPSKAGIQVDLLVQKVGDPTREIASPSILTVVGQDAVMITEGNGANVTCSVASRWDGSKVIVDVTTVISQGNREVSRPRIRFAIE